MAHVLVRQDQELVVSLVMLVLAKDMDHLAHAVIKAMTASKAVKMANVLNHQLLIVTVNSIKAMDGMEIVVLKKEIVAKDVVMANVLDHLSLLSLIHRQLILVPARVLAVGVAKVLAKDLLVHAVPLKPIAITLVMEMVFVVSMMAHGGDR